MSHQPLYLAAPAACALVAIPAHAQPQPYNDLHGREWRQLTTTGLSWDQVAAACPPGGGLCTGAAGPHDLTGWTWATQADVQLLFSYFEPQILVSPCLDGPEYFIAGLSLVGGGAITATQSFFTTVGGYYFAAGWSATTAAPGQAFMPHASASYNMGPFNGKLCVTSPASTSTVPNNTGVWLWRPVPCPTCCGPDLTTGAIPGQPGYGTPNGILNNDDFFYYLAQFAAGNIAVADLTTGAIPGQPGYGIPNGILNNDDFFYYLAIFAQGC